MAVRISFSGTLFFAVQLTDSYLEKKAVAQGRLKLVGVTCVMIAATWQRTCLFHVVLFVEPRTWRT